MSDSHKAWCVICKRYHYFGFDEVGAPVELLACKEGRAPEDQAGFTPGPWYVGTQNDDLFIVTLRTG